jgi:hypothetical protein
VYLWLINRCAMHSNYLEEHSRAAGSLILAAGKDVPEDFIVLM